MIGCEKFGSLGKVTRRELLAKATKAEEAV